MAWIHPAAVEHRRKLYTRPEGERFLRHDKHRFGPQAPYEKSWAARVVDQIRAEDEQSAHDTELAAFHAEHLKLRRELAELKFELAWRKLCRKYGYNPGQPRRPKGDPEGPGRWVEIDGADGAGVQLAQITGPKRDDSEGLVISAARRGGSREPRQPGKIPRTIAEWLSSEALPAEDRRTFANAKANEAIARVQRIEPDWEPRRGWYEQSTEGQIREAKDLVLQAEGRLVELGHRSHQDLIQLYRAQNSPPDLLRPNSWPLNEDVVAVTVFDGIPIFGTNSTAPPYTDRDHRTATFMRDTLIPKYPDALDRGNSGEVPNDGFYHAEMTALLRTARSNGGSLAGRNIEIHIDDVMCRRSCPIVLPIAGMELGNPTVTFVDKFGRRDIMRNGRWD